MTRVDWRELYAANQAAIAAAMARRDPTAPAPTGSATRGLPQVRLPTTIRPGGQRALIHVPPRLDPLAPAPLICMLHGCTQDPATFAAATLMNEAADRHGFVVIYPGQDRDRNPQGCWNWFLPEHQQRGAGEPAAIARIVRDLIETDARCTIDPGRVFVAGLSAGGAMAAVLAMCYPELFAAVAVHSGLAYRSASNVTSALQVMARGSEHADDHGRAAHAAMGEHSRPVPSIVIHGSADSTVAAANAIQLLRQSMGANHLAAPQRSNHDVAHPTNSSRSHVDGGHFFTRSQWIDASGRLMHELIQIDGLGHAWSGGAPGGSFTDPRGPSATEAICTFFSLTRLRES